MMGIGSPIVGVLRRVEAGFACGDSCRSGILFPESVDLVQVICSALAAGLTAPTCTAADDALVRVHVRILPVNRVA